MCATTGPAGHAVFKSESLRTVVTSTDCSGSILGLLNINFLYVGSLLFNYILLPPVNSGPMEES